MQGCTFVVSSFMEYFVNRGKVILLLVEAIGESLWIILDIHAPILLHAPLLKGRLLYYLLGLNTLKLSELLAILKEDSQIDKCDT